MLCTGKSLLQCRCCCCCCFRVPTTYIRSENEDEINVDSKTDYKFDINKNKEGARKIPCVAIFHAMHTLRECHAVWTKFMVTCCALDVTATQKRLSCDESFLSTNTQRTGTQAMCVKQWIYFCGMASLSASLCFQNEKKRMACTIYLIYTFCSFFLSFSLSFKLDYYAKLIKTFMLGFFGCKWKCSLNEESQ